MLDVLLFEDATCAWISLDAHAGGCSFRGCQLHLVGRVVNGASGECGAGQVEPLQGDKLLISVDLEWRSTPHPKNIPRMKILYLGIP